VDGGQILVAITEMVLADLRRGITVRLEQFGDRRVLVLQALAWRPACRLSTSRCGMGSVRDERGTPGRAGLLGVIIRKESAFFAMRSILGVLSTHHAAMVRADIPDAYVVGHDDDDVGLFDSRLC